ncbi:diguanylate cyclase (GGDEF) domain-containing protein [Desulfuromusa kysingii]|uniref:diguanylate cyclase n=1 Tax=Desulfuromusa kysingii TaxID=37625 RepID=A0A1H3YUH1_9BACT|nr:GGDEF domain-containing protein [Desulfuromusa kysingii]SEA14728.1 diguanylate cyclase (GGDEF) domain-containing protein [Desulfuromusa kysingii]
MQTNENYRLIQQLISKELNLPSPPAIAVHILNAVQKDDAALTTLGDIIAADPALTAKMLQVANSSLFARNGKVTSINRAMSVLGTNTIKNIALSFVIAAEFNEIDAGGFNHDLFWRHSVTAAVAAELLSKAVQLQYHDIFVTSLLQDIGMLVISMTKGEEYGAMLKEAQASNLNLLMLESKKYGFDHQQVGYALLTDWHLPESICTPILYHHHPEKAPEPDDQVAAILQLSDQMASVYTGAKPAELARDCQQNLQEKFNFTRVQALDFLDSVAVNSSKMISTFELGSEEIKPYSALLQQANAELAKLNISNEQLILEMLEAKDKAEKLNCELQDANTRLKELVYRDGLTGLYNHRYFQESLANEIARANRYQSSVSLIMFDIDFFKKVNDTHGHPAGDLVLMNIAKAVTNAVRPCDIVARYGGEEFAVILPETNAAGAKVFAARLRRCVEGIATLVEGQYIYVTVSAGATTFSPKGAISSKDALIETADRGLYLSKQNGRNQITVLEPEKTLNG